MSTQKRAHAVITGAAGNLGRAAVQKFSGIGYRISAMISPADDPSFVTSPEIRIYQADLFDGEATEKIIQRIIKDSGEVRLGIMIVGGFATGSILDTDTDMIRQMFDLNFISAWHVTRPLFSHMVGHGHGGLMVFIGARPALDPAQGRHMLAYALSKSLLIRLAEIINEEGKKQAIQAAVVIPGIIDTPRNRNDMPDADFSKWITAEEIAANIAHLVTPEGKKLREVILKVYGEL
jgi:NAD(P)-dependent dehydrogenase (short-subunit alcohol dehydrogenase family)